MKLINFLVIAALAVALSGCGGGGGGSVVVPPADVTGPRFSVPPTAEYDENTGSVIFIATVTDASGINNVVAVVNAKLTTLTLVSGGTYTGTYFGFPDNFGATPLTYTAVVTATDNSANKNKTASNASFTVPVAGPPPPPIVN